MIGVFSPEVVNAPVPVVNGARDRGVCLCVCECSREDITVNHISWSDSFYFYFFAFDSRHSALEEPF